MLYNSVQLCYAMWLQLSIQKGAKHKLALPHAADMSIRLTQSGRQSRTGWMKDCDVFD